MNSLWFILVAAILALPLLSLIACKTYLIPVDSFREQFGNIDTSKYAEVTTQYPVIATRTYKALPVDVIRCVDKNGSTVELRKSPSLEIRFTDTDNRKTTFYFDLISVNGDQVTGGRSRFVTSMRKTISLSTIKKIEIQDGRKRFSYQ